MSPAFEAAPASWLRMLQITEDRACISVCLKLAHQAAAGRGGGVQVALHELVTLIPPLKSLFRLSEGQISLID